MKRCITTSHPTGCEGQGTHDPFSFPLSLRGCKESHHESILLILCSSVTWIVPWTFPDKCQGSDLMCFLQAQLLCSGSTHPLTNCFCWGSNDYLVWQGNCRFPAQVSYCSLLRCGCLSLHPQCWRAEPRICLWPCQCPEHSELVRYRSCSSGLLSQGHEALHWAQR